MNASSERHQFACFYESLSSVISRAGITGGNSITIDNQILVHRITVVLRMSVNDTIVLFDRAVQAKCVITNVSKKTCTVLVQGVVQTHQLKPAITVLLPFLKREALEDALYSCVELGATDIQLIYTKKVHRADCDEKQMQRLQAIVVAAAEQSKNFAFPVLKAPVALPHALSALSDNSVRLFFHGNGASFNQMVDLLRANTPQNIALMVGPEGDCTDEEIILLQGHQFKSFCLTPTVLRSRQALAVGLGAVRSIVSQNNFEE